MPHPQATQGSKDCIRIAFWCRRRIIGLSRAAVEPQAAVAGVRVEGKQDDQHEAARRVPIRRMGTHQNGYPARGVLTRTSQRRASTRGTRLEDGPPQMGLFQQPASAALRYFSAARAAMVPSAMAVVRYL